MAEYPQNPGPLPARDFCNSWGEGNPVLGKGALGNPDKKHMYYTGNDREKQVTTVQTMLQELGYDVGSSGPDGKFGNNTEKAVMAFQQDHRDWNGEGLKVDGLVGPETADALNREMVLLKGGYDYHQTEAELTISFDLITIKSVAIKKPVPVEVNRSKESKKVRIVIVSDLQQMNDTRDIRLHDDSYEPMTNVEYRLLIGSQLIEALSEDGWVHITYPTDQCVECRIEWGPKDNQGTFPYNLDLNFNCHESADENQSNIDFSESDQKEEEKLAKARLNNLGYSIAYDYSENVKIFQRDYEITMEDGLLEDGRLPPQTKRIIWDIFENEGREYNASKYYDKINNDA
jgi:hypothetical protein